MSLIDDIKNRTPETCRACGESFHYCGCDSVDIGRAKSEQLVACEAALLAAEELAQAVADPNWRVQRVNAALAAYRKATGAA